MTGPRTPLLVGALLALFSAPASAQCEQAELRPDLPVADDRFGSSVALEGELALVGAPAEGTSSAGSVYVFQRVPGGWDEVQVLTPPDPEFDDQFGASIDLDGGAAVIGAPGRNDPTDSGAAFVYRWNGSSFDLEQELVGTMAQEEARFGADVGIAGNLVIVGAPDQKVFDGGPIVNRHGIAYFYRFTGTTWVPDGGVRAETPQNQGVFGSSVDILSNYALIGCSNSVFLGMEQVFLFRRIAGMWELDQEVVADDFAPGSRFGYAVDMSVARSLVGARDADDEGGTAVGAAYVFDLVGGTLQQMAKLQPDDLPANAWFGAAVSVDDDRALVGAPNQGDGVVYAYEFDGLDWNSAGVLTFSPGAGESELGTSVCLEGDLALLGADDGPSPPDTGAVLEYLLDGVTCLFQPSTPTISLEAGGTQTIDLRPGQEFAGDAYLVLGSATGTTPGIPFPPYLLPLNLDFYMSFTISNANLPPFTDSVGLLDAEGEGQVAITLPAEFDPQFVGLVLNHAYLVVDALTQGVTYASPAVSLEFVP